MSAFVEERRGAFRDFAALLDYHGDEFRGELYAVIRHMIGLTDSQLQVIMRAARSIPVEKRDTFLQLRRSNGLPINFSGEPSRCK